MDHLSSSQINLYLLCGLKYRYQYIDKLPRPFRSSALVFGGALHSALQWLNEERLKGNGTSIETLHRIFDADWYSQKTEESIKFKEGEEEMNLLVMGKEMLRQYFREEHKEVRGCEVPFTIPLVDLATGEDLGISFEGYFDLIEADDAIVEYKTSAQTLTPSDIDSRLQLTAYSYAYYILNRKPPKRLKVVNFIKGKKPRMAFVETRRDENDFKGFLMVARETLNGIRSQIFIPRTGYWCRDCEYCAVCPLWQRGKEQMGKQTREIKAVNAMI